MSQYIDGQVGELANYEAFTKAFQLEALAREFAGDFDSGISAAIECCDHHCTPGRVALRWEGQNGASSELTFEELRERSSQFAHFLVSLGIKPGDRVAGLLPRIPELLVVIIGTWRAGAVYQPLFTAFGPKAVEYRVGSSEAQLIVTDTVNRHKLDDVSDCPPIMTIAREGASAPAATDHEFNGTLARFGKTFEPVLRNGQDPCMMLFTSGTTGLAKGVAVPHKALMAIHMYMRYAVGLRPDDNYWNIADPGWAYGLYFGAIGPLLMGQAATFYDGPFTVDSTYQMIDKYGITNLAGAPTAYRLLIAAGPEKAQAVKGKLRAVSSAGEPLNPEVIRWFREHLDCPINDHYGQTELGMVLCNFHALAHPVQPGSAGLPIPGYRLAVVDSGGGEVAPGSQGILAVDRDNSPLYYFQGYWRQETSAFVGKYYLTGDMVELGTDGSITFVGRGDDIITSAGYRIGPFDVESCLIEHPSVAETAVVGKPDPERTEIVKAFIVLKPGYQPTPELADELQQMVKRRLAAHAYPREIQFVTDLPKTPSGKIQRFMLRRQETEASA